MTNSSANQKKKSVFDTPYTQDPSRDLSRSDAIAQEQEESTRRTSVDGLLASPVSANTDADSILHNIHHTPLKSHYQIKSAKWPSDSHAQSERVGSSAYNGATLSGGKSHTSPSLVERWVRRRSSMGQTESPTSSRTPFLRSSVAHGHGYSALANAPTMEESEDDFAIDLPTDTDMARFNMDMQSEEEMPGSLPSSRRSSNASSIDDVCFPFDNELEEEALQHKVWPDLEILTEFAENERKELMAVESVPASEAIDDVTGERTPMAFSSPAGSTKNLAKESFISERRGTSLNGRLRPHRIVPWNRSMTMQNLQDVDDKLGQPLRFTYFRDDLEATIHSPNISGLLQPNIGSFEKLFPITTESAPEESASESSSKKKESGNNSVNGGTTPNENNPFWLNVLNPTEEEMKILSRTFGIHPLTTEDIFLGETREKVELFRHYYFVCFRSIDVSAQRKLRRNVHRLSHADRTNSSVSDRGGFLKKIFKRSGGSQDARSNTPSGQRLSRRQKERRANELIPLNMYIIVFREGVLTFHFSPTPHPINVRRRARLLKDYLNISADWISYALIDDITDGFAPLIEAIEEEVNDIEDSIMDMNSSDDETLANNDYDDGGDGKSIAQSTSSDSSGSTSNSQELKERGNMLRRIGECRKRVMSLLRLLGYKADVIKGFAKRCNEQWEVAPRSEIGLYLGDIQDHIVTMVQSLNHYEKLLARSHSNYLAQLNLDMNRVNNETNDVLGKITVLGSIVLPMNIVTGLWGMNVIVPGQDVAGLGWFWCITGTLALFGIILYIIAKRVYKMV